MSRKNCAQKYGLSYLQKHGRSPLSLGVHVLFPSGVLYKAAKAVNLHFAFKLGEANGVVCFDHSLEIKNVVGRLSNKPRKLESTITNVHVLLQTNISSVHSIGYSNEKWLSNPL